MVVVEGDWKYDAGKGRMREYGNCVMQASSDCLRDALDVLVNDFLCEQLARGIFA